MRPIPAADISNGVVSLGEDLSGSVTRSMARSLSDATKSIRDHLKAGRFEEAKVVARELTFTESLDKADRSIRKFTRSAALIGAGAVDSPATSIMANGAGYPFEVDTAAPRLLKNMIAHILTRDTRRRLLQQIGRAERFQKAADPIDPDKLANDINRFLRGEIRRVVDVSANIVGTRVSAYGMFYEARARGISKYRIDAVLDDRTTDICRNMNGRIFEVEFAFTKTGAILNATDPADQKKLAPFPELDQIRGLSNEELQSQGHDTPPFHFLCRSVVTLIGTDREYDPVEYSKFPTSTPSVDTDDIDRFFDDFMPVTLKAIGAKSRKELNDLKDAAAPLVDPTEAGSTALARVVATEAYTGNAFNGINTTLRKHSRWDSANQREIARTLDKTFDDTPALEDDLIVYRGTSGKVYDELTEIGKVYQDDGFASTTMNPGTAQQWGRADAVLAILVPKGQKALPLGDLSLTKYEAEILLPRSSQFRVVGIDQQKFGDTTRNVIKVVMQGTNRAPDLDNLPDFEEFVESLMKAENRSEAKFVYELGDLREASLIG